MSYILSPISPSPVEFPDESKWKERNDRQLRLWGVHGQARIDSAKVCLLNATAVGCEVLKNIVLPGFGNFSVVDAQKVSPRDLGRNFYLRKTDLDRNRAEAVSEVLAELNPEVKGQFLAEDPVVVIEKSPEFFDQFNFIIASQMPTHQVEKFAKYCYDKNKVLVCVRSYGMIGYLRIVTTHHTIVEAKLDTQIDDLRITKPWPDFMKFCDLQDLDAMDNNSLAHTSYPILLVKSLKQWMATHNNQLPQSRQDKEDFQNVIKGLSKSWSVLTNFAEAIDKAHFCYSEPSIPDNVLAVFQDKLCCNLTKDSDDFWIMSAAVKKFTENEGQGLLPLQGRVPDMHSDTERYVKMQSLFRKKARADMEIVKKYMKEFLKQVGRSEDDISEMDLKEFCKNACYLRAIHYRSFEQELKNPNKEEIQSHMQYNEDSTMPFYIVLRAADRFLEKHGNYPGQDDENVASDTVELKKMVDELLQEFEVTETCHDMDKYVAEMVRYGGSELHNISSLMGGVAGQELIKLCTKQRIPMNNTWVFSGIRSVSIAFEA
ncbi:hypothetical protein C9374_003993 [Naegleria lovaniensis]|uniref:NEDD8-activating enzyme E1 regulatory subunit n=1 Tax=Naegleria lovaniensis TaxID=51637 RepID=A0AA88H111_NAELO|nr:uncharacterized protein C9374_003993 [Naegleria lovaniensis]KAG2394229.1 hypothetical protein C9374_003993 [Naegleria lovaniensis]